MVSKPVSKPAARPHKEILTGWVLLLLDGEASYGYELQRELTERQVAPDPSALYRTLRKLEQDGLVESRWMRAVSGPRRRFYRLTRRGRRQLDGIASVIVATREVHDSFLRTYDERSARRRNRSAAAADRPPLDEATAS